MENKILIGIDSGANSLGLAAIVVDSNGFPLEIANALTVRHDNGKDQASSSQTSSVSRKASSGAARRARTQTKNRRLLRTRVQNSLSDLGYPAVDLSKLSTYEPWNAREALLKGLVENERERKYLISVAISHMARHRGWANAWHSIDSLMSKREPTEEFEASADALAEYFSMSAEDRSNLRFQTDLAGYGLHNRFRLRARENRRPSKGQVNLERVESQSLLGKQRREDVIREWREIARVQRISENDFDTIAKAVFAQERPHVPAERIGKEWVPGYRHLPRSPLASLEFQEFRILSDVANLGVRNQKDRRKRRPLSQQEQLAITDTLLQLSATQETPTWRELAEVIGVEPQLLVHNDPEEQLSAVAPRDRTTLALSQLKPKSHPTHEWWTKHPEIQSALAVFLANPTDPSLSEIERAEIDQLLGSLEDEELVQLEAVKVPSGRASHSRTVLKLISDEIRRSGDNYVTVRNRLFGNGQNLTPESDTLYAPAEHPTNQRILPPLRRFLQQVENKFGQIHSVNIEHVRSSFLGFQALADFKNELRGNRRSRELAKAQVSTALGISDPRDGQIRKYQTIQRQQSACLYCGTTLTFNGTELDHIVPRATGGSSRRANLAAVCSRCNLAKGKLPFAVFAANNSIGVTLDGALERADSLNDSELSRNRKLRFRLIKEMKQRLRQTSEDIAIDERSLESTAFAAVEIRRRIDATIGHDSDRRFSSVYRGSVVSEARKVSGIDKVIQLRPGLDAKSRLDRRHHAIDAIVVALMNDSVARTLAERSDLRDAERLTGEYNGWKEHEGFTEGQRKAFATWKLAMRRVAELATEMVTSDAIPVMQNVRFSGKGSKLHEDGRIPHSRKRAGDAWTAIERARVVEPSIYDQLSDGIKPSATLATDNSRTLRLPSGKSLTADDDVYIFPDGAARVPLKKSSSSEMGRTVHHARIYAYLDHKGKRRSAIIRVFEADLQEVDPRAPGGALKAPLPPNSRPVRNSDFKLQDAIHDGRAKHVESIVVGDELELAPSRFAGSATKFAEFLNIYPEFHWYISGLGEDRRVLIRPMLLAEEGLPRDDSDQVHPVPVVVRATLKDGARLNTTELLGSDAVQVVRRSATGKRRYKSFGLPSCFSPSQKIEEAWDELTTSH